MNRPNRYDMENPTPTTTLIIRPNTNPAFIRHKNVCHYDINMLLLPTKFIETVSESIT